MTAADTLERGREALRRQAWADAYALMSAAQRNAPLEPEDLERLAVAAYLIGRDTDSVEVWALAHQAWARLGDAARAARCAFWLAFGLLNKGELARGGGWIDRAQRLLDGCGLDCVEQGCLRYLVALRSAFQGDAAAAHVDFSRAAETGERFGDLELTTLARIGQGRCLIYLGQIAAGVALLDEAMVAVTAGEESPIAVGDAYCTVIEGCQELFDLRRAREWTAALSHWCDAQPELVLYRGQCLVHRAEIMELHGAWSDAMHEVQHALDRLAQPVGPRVIGAALYVKAELHRLRGEFAKAEEAYRQANQVGREPQPGLALLRLAQGQVDAANAAIRRVLDEAQDPVARSRVLAPYVEIVSAYGDFGAARAAADELSSIAADRNAPYLRALSAHVTGSVLLAEGNPRAALATLRQAWAGWRGLDVLYEAARVRVLIGLACRSLGDEDGAEMELDAARSVFQQLGAAPDLARVEELSRMTARTTSGGLTGREVEVLRLVAAGKTNRQIAAELVISEKTVATHMSNIFTKLDLSSRAAATAYAYEHHLL
ncbi:MAG: LuxR C-terminal-related transcriptional regulator [Thermomicrobiales bacterium]